MHDEHMDRLTCEQVFRRLEDYIDRELSPAELEAVRNHLEICAACAAEHRFEISAIQAVRERMQRIAMPPDLHAKISRALRQG